MSDTRYYVRIPDIESKWGYPSGPYRSVDEAIAVANDLRKKIPTFPMHIARRESNGSEVEVKTVEKTM